LYNKRNIKRLFDAHPIIYGILKDSPDIRTTRDSIFGYINEMLRMVGRGGFRQEPLEWSLQNQCLLAFRKILSYRSERLVKFSLLNILSNLAKGNTEELPEDLSDGFFEELIHLFRGMRGRSGIYDQEKYPEFEDMDGREASINRSNWLDEMADQYIKTIKKYPTGMEEKIIRQRGKNRKRIMEYFCATEKDWKNYIWHLKHVIRDQETLGNLIELTPGEKEAIDNARQAGIPFGITPYYVSLMDTESHRHRDHAIRAQVIPSPDYVTSMMKHKDDKEHSFDFMLESKTSPIDLITRRYPSIVILKPYNSCAQICVYCQRNWEVDNVLAPRALASGKKLDAAFQWIREHPAIREVLVTGGDPLVMADAKIDHILSRITEIDHVERIRIGSRTPVVLPMRITDSLVDIIARHQKPGRRTMALVTHFEHPYEVTPEAMESVQKFKRAGISTYNQAVFTVENSRRFELSALRRILRSIGVEPYYTFNMKGKGETQTYRVPMARLRQETKEEARLQPGLVRTDEPVYNVPGLGKNYIRAQQHHSLLNILPNGSRVYEFHPWEKYLSLAKTFIDTDVSIYDYLQELKKRGENIKDYNTIWYYY
jgi:lysine 2,3-aminomutase